MRRYKLVVASLLFVLVGSSCFSQRLQEINYKLFDYSVQIEKKELKALENGCDGFMNKISIVEKGNKIFNETVCSVEIDDVLMVEKGYLTIVVHYSSPVGWSQFYIIDFCQKRIIKTKELEEGIKIEWTDFLEISKETMGTYVEEITGF